MTAFSNSAPRMFRLRMTPARSRTKTSGIAEIPHRVVIGP